MRSTEKGKLEKIKRKVFGFGCFLTNLKMLFCDLIPTDMKIGSLPFYFTFFLLLFFFLACQDKNENKSDGLKNLLSTLDARLEQKDKFENLKKKKIADLREKARMLTREDSAAFQINSQIIEEYLGYQCDSAFVYIDKNLSLAQANHNQYWLLQTELQKSVVLSTTGLFTESKNILDRVSKEDLPPNLLFNYNSAYECFYSNLLDYNGEKGKFAQQYKQKLKDYYQNAYQSLDKNNPFAYLFLSNLNRINGDWHEAEIHIDQFLKTTEQGTRLNAIGSYCKAVISGKLGKIDEQEHYLIISAMSDLESCTKENRSMQELADILYKKGDVTRAYRYIQSSLEDANFYNARFRSIQISKVQPIIEETYLKKINTQNQQLRWSIIAISFLLFGLGATLFFINKQLKIIAKSRNELSVANQELKIVNHKIDEANQIKEEYIAYFINQCSIYLDRFDRYKKLISRRLSTGQIDKLRQMVDNKKNDEMDLDEMYKNFDNAFLRIYPNFVEEFNKLLKDGEEYHIKPGTLNTELRIYALIRLGINDSNQISEFLRYSVRTIYNYRSKVRIKSVIENDDFEKKIMQIGAFTTS